MLNVSMMYDVYDVRIESMPYRGARFWCSNEHVPAQFKHYLYTWGEFTHINDPWPAALSVVSPESF